jgi:hypothetical protein
MAHYAKLDENNIVTYVFVGKNEDDIVLDNDGNPIDWEQYYGAKRTSYNTFGGVHLNGGTAFRKNYAGVGFKYDAEKDAFIPPQLFASWTLNEETCLWEPPIPRPTEEGVWIWVEDNRRWYNRAEDRFF